MEEVISCPELKVTPGDGRNLLDVLPDSILWTVFEQFDRTKDMLNFMLTCQRAKFIVQE